MCLTISSKGCIWHARLTYVHEAPSKALKCQFTEDGIFILFKQTGSHYIIICTVKHLVSKHRLSVFQLTQGPSNLRKRWLWCHTIWHSFSTQPIMHQAPETHWTIWRECQAIARQEMLNKEESVLEMTVVPTVFSQEYTGAGEGEPKPTPVFISFNLGRNTSLAQ